jgi:fused signal recognition particle receptor
VNDRTEEKPKVGLFRRLFGGGSAAPEAAPAAETPPVVDAAAPVETAPPLAPVDEMASLKHLFGNDKPTSPASPLPEPIVAPEVPAALVAPAEPPADVAEAVSHPEPEPPRAGGILGRWFGRGEEPPPPADETPAAPEPPKRSWLSRLTSGLARSSSALGRGIVDVFTKRKLDETSLDDLEDILIQADLGIGPALRLREAIGKGRYEKGIDPDEVKRLLAEEVERTLTPVAKPLAIDASKRPFVILVVGVNGSGKTTTIGKLAAKFAADGRKVLLAAGDTFRAAAIEQLRIWATRAKAEIVAREQGGDAAGLAFDAITKAKADGVDVVLMDTAGRLQNRAELMKELEKIIRVMKKVDPEAPHATLLVLDATVGQNALSQVEIFGRIAGVTGLVMTKLDGTARGGILVAIADKFKLPVHFIGVGEQMDDLEPFEARDFARAIAGLE